MSGTGRYRIIDDVTKADCGPLEARHARTRTYYAQTARRVCSGRAGLIRKSPTAVLVLDWICLQSGSTGGVRTSQGAIARYIGLPRQTVSQALGLLEERGFIASEPAGGRKKTYFVDPEYWWSAIPTAAAMGAALFYKVRRAAGTEGDPAWRQGADPWRLTRAERQTIAYVPDPGAATDDLCEDEEV